MRVYRSLTIQIHEETYHKTLKAEAAVVVGDNLSDSLQDLTLYKFAESYRHSMRARSTSK